MSSGGAAAAAAAAAAASASSSVSSPTSASFASMDFSPVMNAGEVLLAQLPCVLPTEGGPSVAMALALVTCKERPSEKAVYLVRGTGADQTIEATIPIYSKTRCTQSRE